MTKLKTVENDADVWKYLQNVANVQRREDTTKVATMMAAVTAEQARMWGDSIVGFGHYNYKRRDGSAHRWMLTGVAPRKASTTVYIMPGFRSYGDLIQRLGKCKHSSSCLYITKLTNVDFDVLTELVRRSVADMRKRYPD